MDGHDTYDQAIFHHNMPNLCKKNRVCPKLVVIVADVDVKLTILHPSLPGEASNKGVINP